MSNEAVIQALIEEKNKERKTAYETAVQSCIECRSELEKLQLLLAEAEIHLSNARKQKNEALKEYLCIGLSIPMVDIIGVLSTDK